MNRIFLTAYSVRIREKQQTVNYEKLSELEFGDFYNIIYDYLTTLSTKTKVDPDDQNAIRVDLIESRGRILFGKIKTGDYGYEAEGIDIDTYQTAYRRKINHAEIMPFYFLIKIPANKSRAIIILEKFGVHGIKGTIEKIFKDSINNFSEDYIIEFAPIFPGAILNEFFKRGYVEEFTYVKFQAPKDIADRYLLGEDETDRYKVELSIKSKHPFGFSKIRDAINSMYDKKEIDKTLEINYFEPDILKVKINNNSTIKTFVIGTNDRLCPNFDISDDCERGGDGHPIFEEIHKKSIEYLNILLDGMDELH